MVAPNPIIPVTQIVDQNGQLASTGGSGGGTSNVQGTSAAGAADDGSNPVKVAGVDSAGNRRNFRVSTQGVTAIGVTFGGMDGGANAHTFAMGEASQGNYFAVAGWVFNGSTWDRQRGNTAGTFMVGSSANGAADDASNPVKIGGVYKSGVSGVANGQRTDLLTTPLGGVVVSLGGNGAVAGNQGNQITYANDLQGLGRALLTANAHYDPTGGQLVAMRGNTTGTFMVGSSAAGAADDGSNPVKIGGVANQSFPSAASGGARKEMWVTPNGSPVVASVTAGSTADAMDGGSVGYMFSTIQGSAKALAVVPLVQNPTGTRDFLRGDTSGTYIAANVFWGESTTALAANATFVGTTRSNGGTTNAVGSRFSFFIAEAFSDVAGGTLYIDKSLDAGTTWRQVGSIALVAGTSVSLKVPISAPSYRTRVVNGANAQSAALVTTAFSLN